MYLSCKFMHPDNFDDTFFARGENNKKTLSVKKQNLQCQQKIFALSQHKPAVFAPLLNCDDMLLQILSFLDHRQLAPISLTCKRFCFLNQSPVLWKNFVCRYFPHLGTSVCLGEKRDWKDFYLKTLVQEKKNIQFLRKKAYSCFSSKDRLSSCPTPCYLTFTEEGILEAVSYSRKTVLSKDSNKRNRQVKKKDWIVRFKIYNQFIHLALVDGNYPIQTKIQFEDLRPLPLILHEKILHLESSLNQQLEKIATASNLDEQVRKELNQSFEPLSSFKIIRNGEKLINASLKAYYVFFHSMIDWPDSSKHRNSEFTF